MGVLALGLADVILRDKTDDQEFTGPYTEDFRKRGEDFRTLVTRDYSPERVSEITGVPAQTILRLAREYGSAKAPPAGCFFREAAVCPRCRPSRFLGRGAAAGSCRGREDSRPGTSFDRAGRPVVPGIEPESLEGLAFPDPFRRPVRHAGQ